MSKAHAVAVVGDLHVGSTVGLMPPELRLDKGQKILPSPQQEWLWQCWIEYCKWLDSFEVDAIVLNGDLPNGINARDAENLSMNESDQINFVVAVLDPLLNPEGQRRAKSVYVTRGTGFHAGNASWREEQIAKQVDAVRDAYGASSRYVNDLTWREQRLFFTHHISFASVNKLMPLERTQREWRMRCQVRGTRMPDADIRGHVHTSYAIESNDHKWTATLPAWQLLTQHAHKVAPAGEGDFVTGGGVIWLDEKGKVRLERLLFPLPNMQEMIIPT
jgi:hypothetical protein